MKICVGLNLSSARKDEIDALKPVTGDGYWNFNVGIFPLNLEYDNVMDVVRERHSSRIVNEMNWRDDAFTTKNGYFVKYF